MKVKHNKGGTITLETEQRNVQSLTSKKETEDKIESFFTIKYTNIAKGVAVLLMLMHHVGLDPTLSTLSNSKLLYHLSCQSKVCVAIYLILSGYGLYISSDRKNVKNVKDSCLFTGKHLLKLMLNFWVIFVIFVAYGTISGRRPLAIYGSNIVKNMFIDFLGMANLFQSPTYNVTWWFMSLIILLYVAFPIMKWILKKSPILFAIIMFWIMLFKPIPMRTYGIILNDYIAPYGFGMIFAKYKLFDKIRELNKSKVEEILLTIIFLIISVYLRWKYETNLLYDSVLAFAIILFCNNILAPIKLVNKILEILGKNSTNMFLLHTFIYLYFFSGFMLKLRHLLIAYIVLVLVSLAISIIIEFSKKTVKELYNISKNKILVRGE